MVLVQKELKNAYIGEVIEQTFTVSKGNNVNIAKSGYKIKQITTNYTSSASNANQYMSSSVILIDNVSSGSSYELTIPYTYISYNITINNKLSVLHCKYNGTKTNEYTTPALSPVTGPFAFEFTTTTDNVKFICNGTTILDQAATTKWNQTAEYMFGLSNVYASYYLGGSTSYYTGSDNATITVVYEKV